MAKTETVVRDQYNAEEIILKEGVSETPVKFTVFGQTPYRTYEDRDVYFAGEALLAEGEIDGIRPRFDFSTHLKAEDAVRLGQSLIDHGTKALMANMIQHQHIHHFTTLERFVRDGFVEKIIFTQLSTKVPNCSDGWRLFLVKPTWKDQAPEFFEDFEFETIFYPSPFEKEFQEQLAEWRAPIEFVGYDREADLADFQKKLEEFEEQQKLETELPIEQKVDALYEAIVGTLPEPSVEELNEEAIVMRTDRLQRKVMEAMEQTAASKSEEE